MKVLAILPFFILVACNDHQKPPEDVPLTGRPAAPATPPTTPTTTTAPAAAPGATIVTGTIKVADSLKDKVPATATLFIVGRPEGMGGPPAVVKRVAGVTFPYTFTLAEDDAMMKGAPIPEKLTISARYDQDGDAISRTPGDLMGTIKTGAAKGAEGVELVLDEVVTQAQ